QRMIDRRRVAQRHVVEEQREREKEREQTQPAESPMAPVQRQGAGPSHGTGHDDYVQMTLPALVPPPAAGPETRPECEPRAPLATDTDCRCGACPLDRTPAARARRFTACSARAAAGPGRSRRNRECGSAGTDPDCNRRRRCRAPASARTCAARGPGAQRLEIYCNTG